MTVQKAFGCQKRIKRKGDVLQTSDNFKISIGYCMILKKMGGCGIEPRLFEVNIHQYLHTE